MGRAGSWTGRSRSCPRRRCRSTGSSRRARAGSRRPGSAALWRNSKPSSRCVGRVAVSTSPPGVCVELERVEDRLDARVVAVRVVVGGALAELGQPAGQVRACTGGCTRSPAASPAARSTERGNTREVSDCSLRRLLVQLDQVVARARRADQRAQVADRRPRVAHERAQLAQELGQAARRRLRLGDQHVQVVERRRAGSRTSCWRCAACRAAGRASRASATFSSPIAAGGGVGVADQRRTGRSRRSATADTTREVSVTKRWKVALSETISLISCDVVDSAGFR